MPLTDDQINHIAKLSRLNIADEDLEMYREQLSSILQYIEKLEKVNTENVEELMFAAGGSNVFRDDIPNEQDSERRTRIIESFPQKKGDLLEVQAVFEERTE